ncbi:MAG: NPCBM/NEW2 domain-containing protein [Planctomycetota bacterium]|nr:NPCBM/NEW2 domain-containing protein [Planctomycetota bacterium]
MNRTWVIGSIVSALFLAPVSLLTAADPVPEAVVKLKALRQEIEGFGGSGSFRQADNLMKLPPADRQEVLDLLFSTTKGAGISIIRNNIGDGGLTAEGKVWGTDTDGPTATIEPKEGQWSWTGDEAQIWLMKEAAQRGCTRFISAAWSPPAWMKTNNSVINGGNLKKDKYRAYAEYLAEYANGYKKNHGIDIYAVSPQNEPTFSGGYSCCQWSAQDFLELTKNHIIPVWKDKKVAAKYMLGEHMAWDESFAVPSLNDAEACARVDIVAAHGYGWPQGFGVLPTAKAKGKKIWQTEVYNNGDDSNNREGKGTIGNGLYWAEYIHNHMTASDTNAWLYWWLIAKYKFEGCLITVGATPDPSVDPKQAVFTSELITRQTPGRSVDVDIDITNAKRLCLEVDLGDGRFNGDRADWFEPRLVGPKGELKLTDLTWTFANAGWNTPKVNKTVGGEQDIIVNGVKAAYGIGTHAQSLITYDLPPGYTRFKCKAGLDELVLRETDPDASKVKFRVYTRDSTGGEKAKSYIVYPRLWVVGNFSRFVRPGWVRVDATPSPAPGVLVSAYKNPASDDFAVVIINKNDKEQTVAVSLEAATSGPLTPYRTSATESLDKLSPIAFEGGKLTTKLPAQSVTTFVGKAK